MACSREAVELSLRIVEHISAFYPSCAPALRHEALTSAILAQAVARIAISSMACSPLIEDGDANATELLVDTQMNQISALMRSFEDIPSPG